MDYLNAKRFNITTFQDLLNTSAAQFSELDSLLLAQWNKVIFASTCKPELITNLKARSYFQKRQSQVYWLNLNGTQLGKNRAAYLRTIKQYNLPYYGQLVSDLLKESMKVQRVENNLSIDSYIHPFRNSIEIEQVIRECVTCGRDISKQKKGSKYCSEKSHGRKAKQCRNRQSNPIHKTKRQRQLLEQRTYLQPSLFPVYLHYDIDSKTA